MKRKKLQTIDIIVAIVLLSFISSMRAQDSNRLMKLQLAQGFEDSGEWERAVTLYEDLYKLEPANFIFVEGLQRSYTQLKEYEKAIRVIRQWLIRQPRDITMMATLGGLYYDSGNETAADSIWKAVLSTDPHNIQLYRTVASTLREHLLFEKCIRVYLDGRSMSKNDALFADELGSLYASLQQYNSATKEYINLVKTTPNQLSLVQSRLSTFTIKPEGLKTASEIVHAEVKISPDNIVLHRLYAWLLMEGRQYDPAVEQYRAIDRLSNANGNELFDFAQRLSQEHAFKTSAEVFRELIDQQKNSVLLPFARFGYARALEELSTQSDTLASSADPAAKSPATELQPTYLGAIHMYESIAASHPNPDLTAQAFFRIGVIKFEKLFDLDGALNAFNQIKNVPAASNIQYEAQMKIGDVYTARNDLTEAWNTFDRLSKIPLVIYQDQAAFKLAELAFFKSQFDSALVLLKRFDTNLNTDLANDALELKYFIQENKTAAPAALTEFAKAEALMCQRRYSESLVQFQDIVKRSPDALLVDDAMMKMGELHLLLRQPKEALTVFRYIADSIQTSILKDRAQFRIAEIYCTSINNKAQAIVEYEKLLSQFPNSLYAEESRKRIRVLRGDSI